jgi:hypothetical protein
MNLMQRRYWTFRFSLRMMALRQSRLGFNEIMGTAVFRCRVTEVQAITLRERIDKMGLNVGYQEEQHGAGLVLIVKCGTAHAHTVREILTGSGVTVNSDDV